MATDLENTWFYRRDPGPYGDKFHFQVYLGPALVGSIRMNSQGTHKGTWDWNGHWGGHYEGKIVRGSGRSDKLETALGELRNTFYDVFRNQRLIIGLMLATDPAVRHKAEEFLQELGKSGQHRTKDVFRFCSNSNSPAKIGTSCH